jgi:hypothetical protein
MTVPVTRYFHGGIPGLEVGDRILPPSVTGTPTTADYAAAPICRRDRVYASTELRVARVYAALAPLGGHGDVYEVALQDPNEPDGVEVGAGGDSVCAPSATVIRIVERDVDLEIARREIAAEFLRNAAAIAADSAAVAPCPASLGALPANPGSIADRSLGAALTARRCSVSDRRRRRRTSGATP